MTTLDELEDRRRPIEKRKRRRKYDYKAPRFWDKGFLLNLLILLVGALILFALPKS